MAAVVESSSDVVVSQEDAVTEAMAAIMEAREGEASSSDEDDEAHFWPFADAYEEDTKTYPYGTLSEVASHVTTPRSTALAPCTEAAT